MEIVISPFDEIYDINLLRIKWGRFRLLSLEYPSDELEEQIKIIEYRINELERNLKQ